MVAELVEHAQTRQEPPSRPGQARAEAGPAEATGLRTYVVDTSVLLSDPRAANHAWGVMDALADTDFPDIRTKCAIHSSSGSILLIPREGGHLFRMYVDLGEVPADDDHRVRQTPLEEIIRRAQQILRPYTLDVKEVAWHSVYEVGQRPPRPGQPHRRPAGRARRHRPAGHPPPRRPLGGHADAPRDLRPGPGGRPPCRP